MKRTRSNDPHSEALLMSRIIESNCSRRATPFFFLRKRVRCDFIKSSSS